MFITRWDGGRVREERSGEGRSRGMRISSSPANNLTSLNFSTHLCNTFIFLLPNVAILPSASLTHSLSHTHTYYLTFYLPVVYNNTYKNTNNTCPCFSFSFFFRLSRCTWMEEAQMTLVTSLSLHRLTRDFFSFLHSLETLITPFFSLFLTLFPCLYFIHF
jgi:hypothetical protein